MTVIENNYSKHLGRKISAVRQLRGFTEIDLGNALGISAQEVSQLEQLSEIEISRLKEIAVALGVTEQGLVDFSDEKIQYNTLNFYENCGVQTSTIANNFHQTNNSNQYDKISETLELILKSLNVKNQKID